MVEFSEPKTPEYQSVLTRLRSHAERMPDRVCLQSIDQGSEITWGGLYRACNQVAGALAARGVRANDRVVVLSDNSLENLILYYGVQRYGATFCTVNVDINREHLREIVTRLEPKLVLWHDALDADLLGAGSSGEWVPFGVWDDPEEGGFFAEAAGYSETAEVAEISKPSDISVICFTSGTSDKPKGVMHSFENYLLIGEQTKYLWGLTEHDRVLEYRSFSWSSSHQICLNPTLVSGDTLIFAQKYSQSRFFDWIRDYSPSVVIGIPTVVGMLLNRPADEAAEDDELLGRLRFMSCSTSPLLGDQHRIFEERYNIKLIQHYGMSEGGTVAGNRFDARRIGSVGRPGMAQNLVIIDDGGNELETGKEGEIEIGGPQNAYGYLMEDGSVETVQGHRLRTGDIGYLDEDGYLYVTGRAKDIVIRGGVNIAPLEIDNAIMRHPGVLEVATVGVPDAIYGEELISYVVAKPGSGLSEEALEAHCAEALPRFKQPKQLILTDAIARNSRGKIDRRAMAEQWKAAHAPA